jgi:twitching motility protein PilI
MNGEPQDFDSHPGGAERRSRLRQYQVQLLERMQAAKTSDTPTERSLAVEIGTRRYLLDLTQVGEIVPMQPPSPVPLTQDWYLGLANIRGNLTGVIDLARYLGEAPAPVGAESRLLSFAPHLGFNCALLATRVLGLRKPEEVEGQGWYKLDLAQLVREPRFLHVGL